MSYTSHRTNNLDLLQKELAKMQQKSASSERENKDEGFWQPTVDKAGNGSATIRFLPAIESETCPWVRYWDHGFQGPTGKWYIEKSLTTLGLKDPVADANSILWNTKDEKNIEIARARKRRLYFISNIQVIKDTANPENEGKIFYFRYGKKIFDKIQMAMLPTDEQVEAGIVPINVFDLIEGANFFLSIKKVSGYRNYDDSRFLNPSAVAKTDDGLDAIWAQCKPLLSFIAPDQFKSYDELKKRFEEVAYDVPDSPFSDEPKAASYVAKTKEPTARPVLESVGADADDSPDLQYFRDLVEDDD